MKMNITKTLPFLLAIFAMTIGDMQAKIKVACIGNSITGGYSNYPTPLARMLGDEYEVGNFGKGGTGIFFNRDPDYVFFNTTECANAVAFNPDIVVIKFGANDSGNEYWGQAGAATTFKAEYIQLINKFLALSPQPEIILCQAPPMFPNAYFGSGTARDKVAREQMQPIIRELAEEFNCKVVDLYTPLTDKREYFPDDLHPDHQGAWVIAQQVYEGITGNPFTMNPGGVSISAREIDLTGSDIRLNEEGYLEGGSDGKSISFPVHFGSSHSYSLIRVEAKLNTSLSGTWDLYLDEETSPFVSLPVDNFNQQAFSTGELLYDREITGIRTVTLKWNDQDAFVSHITFKEACTPFVPEEGQEYYIANISNGRVLDAETGKDYPVVSLAAYDPMAESQLFVFERFSYDMYRIRQVASGLYLKNISASLRIDNPGGSDYNFLGGNAPQFSWCVEAIAEGCYGIYVPEKNYIGRRMAELPSSVLGSKTPPLTELDYWRIIKKENMPASVPGITEGSGIRILGEQGTVRIKDMQETDEVAIYNLLGSKMYHQVAGNSSVSVSVPQGIYLVTVRGNTSTVVKKVLVR
ncbi:MAG: GDSL-type esterase/lipase family protein [Candidatus Azobacteroides sp.]|nr:GDSL-type esterase/lipase family protein [Candidatus Azobacteroides sp.]